MKKFLSAVFGLAYPLLVIAAPEPQLSLSPGRVQNGNVSLLRVRPPKGAELAKDLAAKAGETSLTFFECPRKPAERCALVPVPLEAKPGKLDVLVTWTEDGAARSKAAALTVFAGKYRETILKVDPEKANPPESEMARIKAEKEEMAAVFASPSATALWDGPFKLPCPGSSTDSFGNRRSFNGELKSVHTGLDMRATTKTPIHAANAGKVVLAKEFFFAGNMVVIDHGLGMFTGYAHLSKIDVAVGQTVKKGDKLGMAGATGRVTGPHLHWTMRVDGVSVNPAQARKTFNTLWGRKG